jgi:transposase
MARGRRRTKLDTRIEEMIAPFAAAAERLDEIPGIGPVAAAIIIAEIGTGMTRFPTAGHLASWAKFAPGVKESAGKKKGKGSAGHGNSYLGRILGEAAVAASKTDSFPASATGGSPAAARQESHRHRRQVHPRDHLASAV